MSAARLGGAVWWALILSGVVMTASSVLYAQSVTDGGQLIEAVVTASADNPLLAVIRIMALVVLGALILAAWLVKIVISQVELTSKVMTKPCVLAHTNPALYAKLLEGGNP